jgi:hypothetical protein
VKPGITLTRHCTFASSCKACCTARREEVHALLLYPENRKLTNAEVL